MHPRPVVLFFLAALALGCDGRGKEQGPPSPEVKPSATPSAAPTSIAAAPAPPPPPPAPAEEPVPEGMVAIPPGFYLMGSRATEGLPEERPMHEVVIPAFFLDRTEVTVRAYAACMKDGACTPWKTGHPFCPSPDDPEHADLPVSCVDFKQADAYCTHAKKRLPTEREWEYAARGGMERRRFSWGEEPPDEKLACYDHRGSCPVGTHPPGAFGLLDMSGNVWEWTSTWFGPYPDEATTGTHRVYRGGSWSRRFPKWLRTGLRNRYEPEKWSASIGLRCARSRKETLCPPDAEARGAACVRVRGDVLCEPGLAWNGKTCTPGGLDLPVRQEVAVRGAPETEPAKGPATEPAPIHKTRTPAFDGDCQSHYQGRPAAYRYEGGTFYSRNPVISGDGCTKRDMGETWTSACCAG